VVSSIAQEVVGSTRYYFDDQFGAVEYSPTTQEVAGSIPAQCKHLCAWTYLFVLGLDVSVYNMYGFTKYNVYKYVFIRHLEYITQAL
jgi:hypothetical protein